MPDDRLATKLGRTLSSVRATAERNITCCPSGRVRPWKGAWKNDSDGGCRARGSRKGRTGMQSVRIPGRLLSPADDGPNHPAGEAHLAKESDAMMSKEG